MGSTIMHVRFNEHENEFLTKVVSEGRYNSKSDAIKTAVRLMEFNSLVNEISLNFKKPAHEIIMKNARKAREETYNQFFGRNKK